MENMEIHPGILMILFGVAYFFTKAIDLPEQ